MSDRKYTAQMVLVGMTPETAELLTEKWPEWQEHITSLLISSTHVVPEVVWEKGNRKEIEAETLGYLKSKLANVLVKKIEPMVTITEEDFLSFGPPTEHHQKYDLP